MKIRLAFLLAIALAASFFAFRQNAGSEKNHSPQNRSQSLPELKPQNVQAVAFGVSPKVSSFANVARAAQNVKEREVRFVSENQISRGAASAAVHDSDQSLASILPAPMPMPSLSFQGIANRTNGEIFGLLFLPSDTNGDVGQNHYVQTVNTLVRIYDKNGSAVTEPFRMSDIFAPLGTLCATRNDGEAIVLYDPLADRWLISGYCNAFPPFRQMIAVSQTGDPTGAYFIYEFVMPNMRLNDYAKFGVWRDGYYMSTDEFVGQDYAGAGLFAFDRARMLKGDPRASYIYFNIPSASAARLGGLLPADLDGLKPPPAGAPNIFAGYTATEYGNAQDALRLFDFHADFENPQSSTFTERPESPLAVAAFDPTSPDGRMDIAQPAPGEFLDSQSDRLMYRVAYRNFGTHESLVFNQTVRSSPVGMTYRAGVRVYELRRGGAGFNVYDQTTLGDNTTSRWMAAAAQDHQGNLAFEYSAGSEIDKPSVVYSGRLASDAVGTFRTEESLVKGTGVQKAFGFRWGNFSGMTVDPVDDCTFWMTNQYFSEESQAESDFTWLTRIGAFKYSECSPAPRGRVRGTVTSAADGQPLAGATVAASGVYTRTTGTEGRYGDLIVLPDSYNLEVSAKGFRPVSEVINVANGQILNRDFSLAPIPAFDNPSLNITAESCAPNNAIDPSETVTVNIGLQNTGARAASNLIATLAATGGVTNPSGAQNYGALAVGASASRSFTFTASPTLACGGVITLTLDLKDGTEPVGSAVIKLNTGTKPVVFQEKFDSVTAPNLPAGWTTSATGAQQNWKTSTTQIQSMPNSVFSPDPNQVGVNELVTPAFSISSQNAEVEFRNWYELETTFLRNRLYDGSVMEIKIGEGAWQDIEAAGGAFLTGGYDGTIDTCCQNPLGGRRGWSGRSGINQTSEFITSKAKLPASAGGQTVQLRWRIGTDVGTFRTGQYIDDLRVTDGSLCACLTSPKNRAPYDFDGDGKTDIGVWRASTGSWWYLHSSDLSGHGFSFGLGSDIITPGDYTGDGKTDLAVFRPSTAEWFIRRSEDGSYTAVPFGLPGDYPAPADYDGDGITDLAVFRPSIQIWFIQQSGGGFGILTFGLDGDRPVPADYDGDGKADIAVWRPSNGSWWIVRSSDLQQRGYGFGTGTDRPVVGDYTGDGKADIAVWRDATREWYFLRSEDGSYYSYPSGLPGDIPAPGDYDGDGRFDSAVFRPSTQTWYIDGSTAGSMIATFGLSGDRPVPNAFVP